jgi:hypothetical protein
VNEFRAHPLNAGYWALGKNIQHELGFVNNLIKGKPTKNSYIEVYYNSISEDNSAITLEIKQNM